MPSRLAQPPSGSLAALVIMLALAASPGSASAQTRTDQQYTQLISRNMAGGIPNGPSRNSVISEDKRYARAIAFESDASDIVPGDTNGHTDVFVTIRGGVYGDDGTRWKPGPTRLVSRTAGGEPANGPSFAPSIDGSFQDADTKGPTCIGFLSAASNLVRGDTNGHVDAFLGTVTGGRPKRISPAVQADTTAIAVSGDCSRAAMITAGKLYVFDGKLTRLVTTDGAAGDPSYSAGRNQDLVYATPSGVWLLAEGTTKPKLVVPGGSNPTFNDVKLQVLAYEKRAGGHTQVMFRSLGKPAQVASMRQGVFGDGDSTDPLIGNGGYDIAFQTAATNLGINALGRAGDDNGAPDVYLYAHVRKLTLLQSVKDKGVPLPAGGINPSMSFYDNYITFDTPAPLGAASGPDQVYMRYLGGVSATTRSDAYDLGAPVQGETAGVVPSGIVKVKLPAGASPKYAKALGLTGAAKGFVTLKGATEVPMGSALDTTRGKVDLYTATGFARPQNDGDFSGGRFRIAQGKKNPLTTLTMLGGLSGCATRVPHGGAPRPIVTEAKRRRHLFSSVHGHFRTRGRSSSATVRGTRWSMTDTCAGTLTTVKEGVVVVRDFRLHKSRRVRQGHHYFARARGFKHRK